MPAADPVLPRDWGAYGVSIPNCCTATSRRFFSHSNTAWFALLKTQSLYWRESAKGGIPWTFGLLLPAQELVDDSLSDCTARRPSLAALRWNGRCGGSFPEIEQTPARFNISTREC
jgi:hypothetical protein